jgi:hypothetical protein
VTPRTTHSTFLPRPASRAPALCVALFCAGGLWTAAAQAGKPRAPKAASTPSTAQILAPSVAATPDALPPTQRIYRCRNAYSPRACGDAKPLDVADARTDAQRRQSEDVTAREQRLARWMEAGRRERDTVASSPAGRPVAGAPKNCVDTAAITCTPKKPRPRHAVSGKPS